MDSNASWPSTRHGPRVDGRVSVLRRQGGPVAEVRRAVKGKLAALLGPWRPARTRPAFWTQLRRESARLRQHLATHSDDLRVLALTDGPADAAPFDAWVEALIDNGVALEVVRSDVARPLLCAATRALFSAFDARALTALQANAAANESEEEEQSWKLLRGLWAPPAVRRGGR